MLSPLKLFAILVALAPGTAPDAPSGPVTLAVADFTGSDKNTARFIADTLLTDLAMSDKLRLAERSQLQQFYNELKLQSTGLAEPSKVRKLGRLAGVDYLIVGSYLERDETVILNARLIDMRTGLVVRGGSAHTKGSRTNLLETTHGLARMFHKRLTGADLPHNDEPDEEGGAHSNTVPSARTAGHDAEEPKAAPRSLIPPSVSPNSPVRERDLSALVSRIKLQITAKTEHPVTLMEPAAAVTRIRALVALVKLFAATEEIQALRPPDKLPPDGLDLPPWARPYLCYAVGKQWTPQDKPFRGREVASWSFMESLLSRMPLTGVKAEIARKPARAEEQIEPDAPTGLIVDARSLDLQRSSSLRIRDQDGRVLYPLADFMPDPDYLQDNGTASYNERIREASRAGVQPIIVSAIGVYGPGRDDLVVSNEMAERIRRENRRGKFLDKWKVAILITPRYPGYDK